MNNKKKFLYITHLSGKRVNRLWISALESAKELGYEVHIACNMREIESPGWDDDCTKMHIIAHQIDFNRTPINAENIKAYKQLKKLMKEHSFDIVHCNTPIGGLLGRICAYKLHVPYVIYQAHGFHFFKGCSIQNILIYKTVEAFMAKYTDALITINKEDYSAAKSFKRLRGQVHYVPGVGVDVDSIHKISADKSQIRKELGIPPDAFVCISVGELNKNKNHITEIRAFINANMQNSYFLVCGSGKQMEVLQNLINKAQNANHIKLLGFRQDAKELMLASDLYLSASKREGLSVALMEALAVGLPCVVSAARGNTDLIKAEDTINFDDIDAFKNAIMACQQKATPLKTFLPTEFHLENVIEKMKKIYESVGA